MLAPKKRPDSERLQQALGPGVRLGFGHRTRRGHEPAEGLDRGQPEVGLAHLGENVGERGDELQPGLASEDGQLAHDARVGDDGGNHSLVVTLALVGIGVPEGQRGIVAVEDPDRRAGPGDACGFGQHRSGALDVADQRMGDDSIEFAVAEVEALRVADAEVDLRKTFVARKSRGRGDEVRAAVDPSDVPREP